MLDSIYHGIQITLQYSIFAMKMLRMCPYACCIVMDIIVQHYLNV